MDGFDNIGLSMPDLNDSRVINGENGLQVCSAENLDLKKYRDPELDKQQKEQDKGGFFKNSF